jgi:hypothetical protein
MTWRRLAKGRAAVLALFRSGQLGPACFGRRFAGLSPAFVADLAARRGLQHELDDAKAREAFRRSCREFVASLSRADAMEMAVAS